MAKSSTTRSPKSATATTRPRNPLATAARQRVAGAHGPTRKAERVAAKIRLKKGLGES